MDIAANKNKDDTKTALKEKKYTEFVQEKAATAYGL